MKRHLIIALAAIALATPLGLAHAEHDTPVERGQDKMSGMAMGGAKSIMLDTITQDGVAAMVHLNDVSEAMAKHGMKETHHMMLMFTDSQSNKPITEGTVAVKIIDPAGTKGEPIKMMPMGDGFGADVTLAAAGKYSLEVGTKLADGKRRVFTYTYQK